MTTLEDLEVYWDSLTADIQANRNSIRAIGESNKSPETTLDKGVFRFVKIGLSEDQILSGVESVVIGKDHKRITFKEYQDWYFGKFFRADASITRARYDELRSLSVFWHTVVMFSDLIMSSDIKADGPISKSLVTRSQFFHKLSQLMGPGNLYNTYQQKISNDRPLIRLVDVYMERP